jgi:amino acid adenylation domain-containing protein
VAWAQVLARASGRDDVVFGTVLFGRIRGGSEVDRALGLFINTLPIRIRVGGESVRDAVRHVHALLSQLLRHQHAPLVLAQRCSAVAAPAPLFSALLNFRHGTTESTGGLEAMNALEGIVPLGHVERSNYPLTLEVDDLGEGFFLSAQTQTRIDPQRVCEYMHTALAQLVAALETAPTTPLHSVDVLPAEERHQVLVEWNDTATPYPRERCVHELFEEQAARAPDAVAVVCEAQQLTYGELNARANQLAHCLRSLDVGPDVAVAVCLERSPQLIVALLAVLKAGGAYVPLDPSYPHQRLAFMLADTGAPVLLTQEALLEQLPPFPGRILCLDREAAIIAAQPQSDLPSTARAEHLAYVMYTSGSTGTPKGVAVPHRGVVRLVWGTDYAKLDDRQTFLLLAPTSFDASTFESWGALLHGARCAIFPERVPTMEALGAALARQQVSTLWLTASLFNLVVDQAPHVLAGLGQLLTGGEALSPDHVRRALTQRPDLQLINGYGPTEGTTFTCCYRIPRPLDEAQASIPIGRPIGNTTVHVLDPSLNPVPIGVPGELYIGGDGLARGYLHAPALTAEKFVPDPFAATPGARLYRTGDLARYRPDGNIEFLGRLDDQVKIRGFRIEPGEIEAVLADHPSVGQAVVLAREDTPGHRRLVAYVVPADVPGTILEPLRAYVRDRLPDYMWPASYVFLERLPLTSNGKIDRPALPPPDGIRPELETGYRAPTTKAERTISAIWQELLHVDRVGADDNFFDLGGHSFLLVEAHRRLNEVFGKQVSIPDMFRYPSVKSLARYVSGRTTRRRMRGRSENHAIAEIFAQQLEWVKTWRGSRVAPESFIVTLNASGTRHGLFWCLQSYRELTQLAKHLGSDQPVHGMRSGHHIMTYTDENVGALASRYAAEMIVLQPDGPFLLGGNCQGGWIARAIALRLRELGRTVSLLVLMEQTSFPPYDGPVALIFGRDSEFNPYRQGADPDAVFRRAHPAGFTLDIIEGKHGKFFHSPNIETLAAALKTRLVPRSEQTVGGRAH